MAAADGFSERSASAPERSHLGGPNGLADQPVEQSAARLTAAQAAALREQEPALSPWRVVAMQCVAGVVLACVVWFLAGEFAAKSAAYGAIAVIIPAALFARGIMSKFSSLNAATSTFGFFLWEAVKLGASVVLIALAPRFLDNVSWLAMMAGLFVTLKMYWLALLWRPRPKANLKA